MATVALSSKAVGSTVKLKVNGTAKNFIVVHQGKPGSMYDASCDGTWLLMQDCYESRQWHSSNNNDYENSTIDNYLNTTFLNLFESNIRDAIKQVKIPYRKGAGYGKTVTSGSSGLSTKIFLLSSTEVNLVHGYEPTNEGACLSYFSGTAQNGADNKRVAKLNGSATSGGSALRIATPTTVRRARWSWAAMAAGAAAAAPTRMASAPLWYFPLLSLSLTTGRFRRTRLRLSAVRAATVG